MSAVQKVESGQVHSDDGLVTKDSAVEHPPGYRSPLLEEKRRRDGSTAAPKKRRRGKPGEICQLNLDVLFLVRELMWCFDRLLTDAMAIARRIRPPHRPPQSCTHMQISSTAPDG